MHPPLQISPVIGERFPGYRALVVFAYGLHNGPSGDYSRRLLQEVAAEARTTFVATPLADHPHLRAWREAYRAFGVKPQRMLNSAEALLTRLLKGGELPPINRLVDAYNAISVRYVVPCGGENLDAVRGTVTLRMADGTEPFDTMKDGAPAIEYPQLGEVVWADEAGVTCRAWNWRQGVRTRLTEQTTNAYFLFDALPPMTDVDLERAGDELEALVQQWSPGCRMERLLLRPLGAAV